jgi:hypothetical protein
MSKPIQGLPGLQWSEPYHGLQHLGELNTKGHWVTVIDYSAKFAELLCRFPGCGFGQAIETRHDTVEEAKKAGEKYMRAHYQPK